MTAPNYDILVKNFPMCQERYIKKHYPEFYSIVKNISSRPFKENLWIYYNGNPPLCNCGNPTKFISLGQGYKQYCSKKCLSLYTREQAKKTCEERYGGVGFASAETVKKIKQTKQERYGDPNYSNHTKAKNTIIARYRRLEIPNKIKQTKQERYGDPNYNNYGKICITKQERYGDPTYSNREQAKETCLKRYGDPNYSNREQAKKTCEERYGGVGFASAETVKKIKQTKQERYGDPNYSNREQAKETCLKRYGVLYPMQNEDIKNKSRKSIHKNTINNNGLLIGYDKNFEWICKCPHLDCNKCSSKNFITCSQIHHDRLRHNAELCTILNPIGYRLNGVSKISQLIFEQLDKYLEQYTTFYNNKNYEHRIGPYSLDYYIKELNVCIEFNGDMWHANPRIYSATDRPNPYSPELTSEMIWTRDYNKYEYLGQHGITTIVLWESDWENKLVSIDDIVKEIFRNNGQEK